MPFHKATKKQAKARVGIFGPSGSGKTYTSLILGGVLAQGKPLAVIDTESKSASKYADKFDFITADLPDYSPKSYINTITEAVSAGAGAVVIDSLSHAWMGRGGVLEMVDKATAQSSSKNAYTTGWRDATPQHNALIEAIISCPIHIIATMRAKQDYVIDNVNGRSAPRKVGLAPVQREGMEYEFDIVCDLDVDNRLFISKTRCSELSGQSFSKPGKEFGEIILKWLSDGEPEEPAETMAEREDLVTLSDLITATGNAAVAEKWLLEKFGVQALGQLSRMQVEQASVILKSRIKP